MPPKLSSSPPVSAREPRFFLQILARAQLLRPAVCGHLHQRIIGAAVHQQAILLILDHPVFWKRDRDAQTRMVEAVIADDALLSTGSERQPFDVAQIILGADTWVGGRTDGTLLGAGDRLL